MNAFKVKKDTFNDKNMPSWKPAVHFARVNRLKHAMEKPIFKVSLDNSSLLTVTVKSPLRLCTSAYLDQLRKPPMCVEGCWVKKREYQELKIKLLKLKFNSK